MERSSLVYQGEEVTKLTVLDFQGASALRESESAALSIVAWSSGEEGARSVGNTVEMDWLRVRGLTD